MIKNKENIKYNYAYLPILVDEKNYGHTRNELFDELEANCIYARKYFYPIITDYHCYKDAYKNCDVTVAEYVSQRIITVSYTHLDVYKRQGIGRSNNHKA